MDSLLESSSRPITIYDGTGYSAELIAELIDNKFISKYKLGGKGRNLFYCGIATDIYQNRSRHESELKRQIEYFAVYECADAYTAGLVEQIMKKKGYDTGNTDTFANGGTENSKLVYVFEK